MSISVAAHDALRARARLFRAELELQQAREEVATLRRADAINALRTATAEAEAERQSLNQG